MVAADARTAITFALSPGNAHDAPEGRELLRDLGPMPEGLPLLTCALSLRHLPALLGKVRGDVANYQEWLIDLVIAGGIKSEFKDTISPALGISYGARLPCFPATSYVSIGRKRPPPLSRSNVSRQPPNRGSQTLLQ
jgi:hypothetical protein